MKDGHFSENQKILFDALMKKVRPLTTKVVRELKKKKHREKNVDYLFDGKPFVSLNLKKSKQENFIIDTFYKFGEIISAQEAVILSEKFLRAFPAGKSTISKKEYLQYHYEAHLQNMHNLKERIRFFIGHLKQHKIITKQQASILTNFIHTNFNQLYGGLRDSQVHTYKVQKAIVKRLGEFELLDNNPFTDQNDDFKKTIKYFRRKVSYDAKQEIYELVKKQNKFIEEIVDIFFKEINKFLLDKNKIKIPDF